MCKTILGGGTLPPPSHKENNPLPKNGGGLLPPSSGVEASRGLGKTKALFKLI